MIADTEGGTGLKEGAKLRWGHLRGPEGGVRLAAQLVEAVVDGSLEHAVLQEGDKGPRGADLAAGVVEGDLHIGMLLLLVHKGAQPWRGVRRQLIPKKHQNCCHAVFACMLLCPCPLHTKVLSFGMV